MNAYEKWKDTHSKYQNADECSIKKFCFFKSQQMDSKLREFAKQNLNRYIWDF